MNDGTINEAQGELAKDVDVSQQVDITEAVKNSPILARLIEEVRIEQEPAFQSYNRMHNRHNRSR